MHALIPSMSRDFMSPSVDILNVLHIQITSTNFFNNTVNTINDRFRADAAGLSLSYHFPTAPLNNATATISNCTFADNIGRIPTQLFSDQISSVLNRQFYPARGGALGIIITEWFTNVTATFDDCLFEHNFAESFGGGAYLGLDGGNTVHTILFVNSRFQNNICDGGGGGIFIGYLKNRHDAAPSVVLIEDSNFEDNYGNSGGGILALQVRVNGGFDYLIARKCNFTHNKSARGSGIGFGSLFNIREQDDFVPSVIEDWYVIIFPQPHMQIIVLCFLVFSEIMISKVQQ